MLLCRGCLTALLGIGVNEIYKDYYRKSQNVIIPAIHGSERTVLEAMSMDILPLVTTSVSRIKNKRIKDSEFASSEFDG